MAAATPPEQELRQAIELGGRPVELSVGVLEKFFAAGDGPDDRLQIAAALAGAGVETSPPLTEVAPDDVVRLSAAPPVEDAEPEADIEPAPAEVEPAPAEVEPAPEEVADPEPPEEPTPADWPALDEAAEALADDDPLATSQRMLEREFRARAEAENQIGVVQVELARRDAEIERLTEALHEAEARADGAYGAAEQDTLQQEALTAARKEAARREEEIERMRLELEAAREHGARLEAELETARSDIKPRAARRIEALERELDEARAELGLRATAPEKPGD